MLWKSGRWDRAPSPTLYPSTHLFIRVRYISHSIFWLYPRQSSSRRIQLLHIKTGSYSFYQIAYQVETYSKSRNNRSCTRCQPRDDQKSPFPFSICCQKLILSLTVFSWYVWEKIRILFATENRQVPHEVTRFTGDDFDKEKMCIFWRFNK